MKANHYYITFLLIMAVGLAVYLFSSQGWYPVAIVNAHLITAKTWTMQANAANQYYSTVLRGQNLTSEALQEIRRATLDKIIENELIYSEFQEKVGKESDQLVLKKIEGLNINENKAQQAVSALYGLSFNDFRNIVLVPEARKEILANKLSSEKQDFDKWLAEIKSKASVTLLTNEFSWSGSRVEMRD